MTETAWSTETSPDHYADAGDYDEGGARVDDELERTIKRNQRIAQEAEQLRIREAARERVAAEKAAANPAPPYDAGTLRELLGRPSEPPHRVQGLIPSDAGTLIVAQRKTGKTTLILNLARALLTGEDFLGKFPVRPLNGIVTILNYEVSAATIARWADEHHVNRDQLYLVNLRGARNPLLVPAERLRLAEDLRARGTETLIVDTYSRAAAKTVTEKGNSGQVNDWLTNLDFFTRTEVGARDLILTTHAGWSADGRSRDSSAIEDWPDAIIVMTKNDDGDRFLSAYGRDVELDEDQLSFDPTTRTLSLTGTGSRKKTADDRRTSELAVYVVRAARQQPGLSYSAAENLIRDMDDAPTFRNGDVAKAARHAKEQGHLHIGRGPRGAAALTAIDPTSPSSPHPSPGPLPTSPTSPLGGEVEVGQDQQAKLSHNKDTR